MKSFFMALMMILSNNIFANECQDLVKCVEVVSKLTGKKYFYDAQLRGDLKASSNFQLTAENADALFSSILNINGYTRVPTTEKGTYKIVASRDVRYETFPVLSADLKTTPQIPATDDYFMLTYQFTHYKNDQMRETSNSLRPFMSRYGRVIEIINSGTLTIQETGTKLLQLLDAIRRNDRQLSKEEIALKKEREKRNEKRESHNKMNNHKGNQESGESKTEEIKSDKK